MSEQNDSFQTMCLRVVFTSDILRDYERVKEQKNQLYSLPFGQAVASMY